MRNNNQHDRQTQSADGSAQFNRDSSAALMPADVDPWYESIQRRYTLNLDRYVVPGSENRMVDGDIIEIVEAANDICVRYPQMYDASIQLAWPRDFVSIAQSMSTLHRKRARIVYGALNKAIISQWMSELTITELKVMLFMLMRTWDWCKPMEGISLTHFTNGFCDSAGVCIQTYASSKRTGIVDAIHGLSFDDLILVRRIRMQSSPHLRINVYEPHVANILLGANQLKLRSRQHERQPTYG